MNESKIGRREMIEGWKRLAWRRVVLGGLLVLAALGLVGCPGGRENKIKSPTSVLWLGEGSQGLEVSEASRLRERGVGELFVDVADLDLSNEERPLIGGDLPPMPASSTVTLVVDGPFSLRQADDDLATVVASEARQLRFDAEEAGVLPVGLHFDFDEVASWTALSEFLDELRGELEGDLFLSFSIERGWLGEEGLASAAAAADFVVPFLYGQRVHETEDGSAWDFIELERRVQQVEALGRPYFLGLVTLGTATHLNARGMVKARKTPISLLEILWNRDLKLRPGFSLEGVNRRVYSVEAEKATEVGGWTIESGEGLRVVRAATSDLEELMRLIGTWEMPNHLGQVYYRLPKAEEKLSLSLGNLLNALDSAPAAPDLYLDASLQRRTGRGWLIRFSITNRNGEITELSLLDSNYLEVHCLNCVFGRADNGDFYRYDLYQEQGDELVRTFRRSDLIRLHVPILEGDQKVASGDVETYVTGEPRLELSGQFLLPDGRTVTLEPLLWPRSGDS